MHEIELATRHMRVFASGLRNTNGLSWNPESGELWVVVNEAAIARALGSVRHVYSIESISIHPHAGVTAAEPGGVLPMASFLAGLAAAACTVKPLPDTPSEPVGARALQAKLMTELGGVESPPDADLLALYRRYRQARKDMHKVFAERVDSSAEADAVIARRDAIVSEIAKMPAATPRGFGAKMDVLRSCGCAALESVCPTTSGEMLLQSVAADGCRLFGAGDAPLPAEEPLPLSR